MSKCVIIDCMERRFIICVNIRLKATGSYASSWSEISIISIDSNPEDNEQNYPLEIIGSQGIWELVSNCQQWWTSYFVGPRMCI